MEHHDEILKTIEVGGNLDVINTDFAEPYTYIYHAELLNIMKSPFVRRQASKFFTITNKKLEV